MDREPRQVRGFFMSKKHDKYSHHSTHAERMAMAGNWNRDDFTGVRLKRGTVMIPGKHYPPEPESVDVHRNSMVPGTYYENHVSVRQTFKRKSFHGAA